MGAMTSLVLFSAGQDSTVCLAWALEHFARVETIGFAYGQRHSVEMTQRPVVRAKMAAAFPSLPPSAPSATRPSLVKPSSR
jgi:7-cyano-7-deazaguanine synthase